ncbi:MAG TPA: outer membrane beta-barrel protein [Vicinamibacterales bacterium]
MRKPAKPSAKRIGALLVVWAVPATVTAQTTTPTPIDDVRQNESMHFGPLYAKPTLQLKEFGIDNNVFNTYGEQRSDFTLTFAPRMDWSVPVAKRALFQATTAADLVWYAQYASERSVDPQLDVRGRVFFRRLTLFAERDYLNTRQRPNQEIDVRARHVDENLTGGVELAVTPELSVRVAGQHLSTRYDATSEYDNTSLQRTLNRDTDGIAIKSLYRLTALTSIGARFDDLQDRFPMSPGRNSDSIRVMPGVEFKPRALISGTAYVGYRQFTPLDPTLLPDFRGLVAQLGLSYTLLGATTFGVSYNRDLTYSYDELQPFFIDNSVGASVRRALGRRFDALLSADRHAYEYEDMLKPDAPPGGGVLGAIPARVDTTWNYTASVGYRLGRDGRIGAGVSYWHRDSTTRTFRAYDNLRVGTTMTFGF